MNRLRIFAGVALLGFGVMALRPSNRAAEIAGLREHFAIVERELLARDVSALSPAQRTARAELVRQLRRYAAAGKFPRNEYLPGQVPFFRDTRGNLCAMAFLIAASGRGDIVDHVARTRNNAYVAELVDEPALAEWLNRQGLSLVEAARIQPTYGGESNPYGPSERYVAATVAAGTLSVISVVWNARSMNRVAGHRPRALVGIIAGGINLGLGLAYIGNQDNLEQGFGAANTLLGTAAMSLGVRALLAKPASAAFRSPRLTLMPVAAHRQLGFHGTFSF